MFSGIKGCVLTVLLLLIDTFSVKIHGWRPFVVHIDELTSESFTPKCRVNSSISYPGLMNLNVDILETVKSTFNHIELFLKSDDGKYDLELMNRTVDMCRLFRDITYEPILQVGLKLYKSNSTFIKGCVMKKGFYSLKNLKLNVEKLPPFFPEKSGFYKHIYYTDKRIALFKVNLFFSVNKVYKNDS